MTDDTDTHSANVILSSVATLAAGLAAYGSYDVITDVLAAPVIHETDKTGILVSAGFAIFAAGYAASLWITTFRHRKAEKAQ